MIEAVSDGAAAIELTGRSMQTTNRRRRRRHNGGIRFAAGAAACGDCAEAWPAAENGASVPMTTSGTTAPMHGRHCHRRAVADGHFHRRNGSSSY